MARKDNRDRIRSMRTESRQERERILKEQDERLKSEQAERLVQFFTRGPDESLDRQGVLSSDADLKERFFEALFEVGDVIKSVISSYEDFFDAKVQAHFEDDDHVARTRKRLNEALQELNKVPTLSGQFSLGLDEEWDPVGSVKYQRTTTTVDQATIDYFGNEWLAHLAAERIENFKRGLTEWQENFPVGVCRYEHCQILFIKHRRDQRYCTSNHATYARIQRSRGKT